MTANPCFTVPSPTEILSGLFSNPPYTASCLSARLVGDRLADAVRGPPHERSVDDKR